MSCIKTYTGVMFDPLKPEVSLICEEDIAHALSMLCRANGHFKTFYSVGQHCINCLLHDASEAYLSDVTRPVKKELPKYLEIEEPLQAVIWEKYLREPLTQEEYTQVFDIDDAILYYEFVALMDTYLAEDAPILKSQPIYDFTGFGACEAEFLRLFRMLTADLHQHGQEDCHA